MRIDPYTILGEIGEGGMGTVFRARSPDGRDLAIKVLQRRDSDSTSRFGRERRLLGSLGEADGFVPLIDAQSAPVPYIVMPFMEGGTLRGRMRYGPMDLDDAIELVTTLSRAIGRAHEQGIVHRDLKPENILFTADGRPLVADLGLAKHFDRSASSSSDSVSLSKTGGFRGTVGYMAPEQMGNAKTVGPQADVFALGAILYECLSGKRVFEGKSKVQIMASAAFARHTPVRKERPDVPAWLDALVERALAPEPEARFPHGSALAFALETGAEAAPTSSRALTIVCAAVLSVTALVVGLAVAKVSREGKKTEPVVVPKTPLPPPPLVPAPPAPAPAPAPSEALDQDDYDKLERHLSNGWMQLGFGDSKTAITEAKRATKIAPSNVSAWTLRGVARHESDPGGGLEDLDRAVELGPKDALAHFYRGVARGEKGDNDGAIDDLTTAFQLDRTLTHSTPYVKVKLVNGPFRARGEARERTGDVAGARADYERFLELFPNSSHVDEIRERLTALR